MVARLVWRRKRVRVRDERMRANLLTAIGLNCTLYYLMTLAVALVTHWW
jgi:hypothetical protein